MINFSDFTKLSDFPMRKCFESPISLSKLLFYLVSLDYDGLYFLFFALQSKI